MMLRILMATVLLLPAFFTSPTRASQYECERTVDGFHLLELREDNGSEPLFNIERIEYVAVGSGQLKVYVDAGSRDAIRAALDAGSLTAEASDGQGSTPVTLTLTQECRCSGSSDGAGSAYVGQSCEERCGDAGVEEEHYYFRIYTSLAPGMDLAIGLEPSQLWLIERP